MRLAVEVVETLGPELTVHGQVELGGEPRTFVAVIPPERRVQRGDVVPLRVENLHLFDGETERSLRVGPP